MSDLNFRTEIEQYIRREASPAHKYSHQPRLYAVTQQIAGRMSPAPAYDDDVVYAAIFLHDLGVFVGHRPEEPEQLRTWDHVKYAIAKAPALLASFGFPADKVPAVLACIHEHQPHDAPTSFESTLVRDADILEQLGAIAVLRTASKAGSDTRFHSFADVRDALQRALDTLPAKIALPATRELATPRIAALQAFLDALASEAGEHLQ